MDKKYKILIVDDAQMNRMILADMLSEQYEILEASNGKEAISILEKHQMDIALVLLDIVMPVMDGFEVLTVMNKKVWIENTPVITISSETSSIYIDRAYDLGATDYINRPFDEKTVQRRVKNTIMLYAKQKMLEGMVAEQVVEKEKSNFMMVEILSNIVEFRNGESGLHILNIRTITELLLQQLMQTTDQYQLTSAQIALIVYASALHDIGKISIPEEILNKPGKLTAEEFEIMKTHSKIGAQILENAPYWKSEKLIQIAHDICLWHHERYDGRGYPDGLKGEEIPISAQVVSLADVYDALTSERVYKPAFSHEEAMKMIIDGKCGTFSPILLQCLVDAGPRMEAKLKGHTPNEIIETGTQHLTNQLLNKGQASNRTLALLDQERIKYQFFVSTSEAILFEYNENADILSLSEWSAALLGISELIVQPAESEELHKVFPKEALKELHQSLCRATPASPVVKGTYSLNVQGEKKVYNMAARPLWAGEESSEVTGIIGKFSEKRD